MFLGNVMLNARHEKGLKQAQLAAGICTQNTITKIERYNTPPTVRILVSLCKRLNLTLNDVFSDFENDTTSEEITLLQEMESKALLGNLEGISDQTELFSSYSLGQRSKVKLHIVECLINISKEEWSDAQFLCNVILQETESDNHNVNTILAWSFLSISYRKTGRIDQAQYFVNLIEDALKHNTKIQGATSLEIVYIFLKMAEFYDASNEYKLFVKYTRESIDENMRMNTTYLLDDLYQLTEKMKKSDYNQLTFNVAPNVLTKYFNSFNNIERDSIMQD